MASLGDLIVKVGSDITGFNSGMEKVSGGLDKLDKEIHKKISGFEKLGTSLTSLGTTLSVGITAPLVGIGAAATVAFGEFQSSLNRASAQGDIYGKDLDRLKAQALDLGAKTQFSAKQAADGMAELAAAGFKTSEIMSAMPGVLNLAAAGQISVGEAAKYAKDILGQFQLEASSTQNVVDVMTKVMTETSATMGELANTMRYVGPVARSLGLDITQTGAAIIELDKAGIRGEQAGTSLRAMLLSLPAPSRKAAEEMNRLGIDIKDASGNFRPFNEIMEQFRVGLGKLPGPAERAAAITKIFGREAASAATVLTSQGGPALLHYEGLLKNVDGTSERVAKTINQGFAGAMERMKGSIETAGIALGEVLAPTIIKIAGFIEQAANVAASLIGWFQKLPEPVQMGVLAFGALAAAIGPLTLAAGLLVSSWTNVISGLAMLSGDLRVATGEITQLAAAKTALANVIRTVAAPALVTLGLAIAGIQLWELKGQLYELGEALGLVGKEAQKANEKLAETKAVMPQTAAFTKYFKDVLEDLSRQFGRMKWSDLLSPLGLIRNALEKVTDAVNMWRNSWPGMEKASVNALKKIQDETRNHMRIQAENATRIGQTQSAHTKLNAEMDRATEKQKAHTKAVKDHEEPARKFDAALLNHLTKLRELSAQLQAAIREQAAWTLAYVNGVGPMHDMARALDGVKVSLASVVPELKTVQGVIREVSQDVGEAGDDYDGLAKKVKIACADSKGDLEDFGRANKSVWSQIKDDISQAVDAFSGKIGQTFTDLLTGEFSLKKVTDAFKDLGLSIIDSLMEKGAKAITTFVTEHIGTLLSALTKVLEKIPLIGDAISGALGGLGGILGGAGKAAGTAAGTATQTAGSAAGAAGSGAPVSGALGSALGWAQLGTSIVDTVFGIFQRARQENTLNAIEENTRYTKGFTYALVEGAIEYWPKITDIWSYLWNTQLTALNTLTVGLETVHDWLRSIDTYLTHIWRDTGDIARNTIATFEFLRDEIATRLGSKAEESTGAEVRIADSGELAASLSDLAGILRDGFARVVDVLAGAKQQIVNVEYRPVGNIGLDAAAQLSTANNTLSGISAILSRATGILNPNVAVTAAGGEAQTLLQAIGKLGASVADGLKTLSFDSMRLVQEAAEGFSDLTGAVMEGARATVAELAYTNQLLAAGAGNRTITVNVYATGATTEVANQIAELVTRRLSQEMR